MSGTDVVDKLSKAFSGKPHRYSSKEAFDAVRAFNEIAPQLTMYARHITGNPHMRVESTGDVTSTDGKTIFIRPPLGFGVHRIHDRPNCGRRDENYRQICDACDKRELIDFYLFHEIAHVAFGSHNEHGALARSVFEDFLRAWHPREACSHAIDLSARRAYNMDVINVTNVLDPILATFFNAFEDARVNEAMFQDRIGLRAIFEKHTERLMYDASSIDENTRPVSEGHPDIQFMLGIMCKAMSIDPRAYLTPSVAEAISDPIITNICRNVAGAATADHIMQLAYDAFCRAQALGYCVVPKCEPAPPPPPMPEPEPDSGYGDSNDDDLDDEEPSDENQDPSSQKGEGSGLKPGDGDGDMQENDDKEDETDGPDESDSSRDDDSSPSEGASGEPSPESSDDELDRSASDDDHESSQGEEDESDPSDSTGDLEGSDVPASELDDSDESEDDDDPGRDDEDAGSDGASSSSTAGSDPGDSDVQDVADGSDPLSEGSELDNAGSEREGSDEDSSGVERSSDDVESGVDEGDGGRTSEEVGSEDDMAEYDDGNDSDPWDTPAGPEIDHEAILEDAFNPPSVAPSGLTDAPLDPIDPSDIAAALKRFMGHDVMDKLAGDDGIAALTGSPEGEQLSREQREQLVIAILQAMSFDSSSRNVAGIEMISWPKHASIHSWYRASRETVERFMPAAGMLSRALLTARRAFEDNRRARIDMNKTSGRIRPGVLGRRAALGDDRLFGNKTIPKKRSYKVVICVDCSGSMHSNDRMRKIKRIVFAQAELLHGLGVPFEIFAYSGGRSTLPSHLVGDEGVRADVVYIQMVKEMNDTWSDIPKSKLAGLEPVGCNFDGHTMEYARKRLQRHASNTTDPILIYFTDGAMPMENYTEEREILEREVELMGRLGITALGVGLHTDSPSKYGLDTVQVDSDSDIIKVVEQLDKVLTAKREMRR